MRIAMVGSRGIPARSGGVERVVEQLAGELARRGHELIVYCRGGYVSRTENTDPVKRIFTPGIGGKFLDTITHTSTAMLDLLFRKVDVVHVHSPGPAMLAWIPALARKPLVLTVHAPDWRRDKWPMTAKMALKMGLACGMRLADAVTAVSPSLAGELSELYGREVSYVPNAPGPTISPENEIIDELNLTSDNYGLYVGRIVPEKRLDLLLRAWRGAEVSAPLVVVGDVDASRYGRDCRKQAPPDGVIFAGPRYGGQLAGLYANAALVVQPSVLEGMSLVLLEAGTYRRCIIAADITANRDTLGDSALYFKPDDISELSGLICRCLEQETLRSDKGRRAGKFVKAEYSWTDSASRIERIYQQVLRGVG